ncbi:MAG: polysaccharide deacetylase family protein [candidate division KSB1 bacterium]|nr:polysaccharide deacetylase family protein [candidate division KSB1 bacterium]
MDVYRRWRHRVAWMYRKNLDDLYWMLRSGLWRRLQSGGILPGGQPPIFVFHTVKADRFRDQLAFLAANGYKTLRVSELSSPAAAAERCVALTFDDARRSLFDSAFPLLREFGFQATAFVVTGCVPGEAGHASGHEREAETGLPETRLCTWPEMEAMAATGRIEFQSHTHRHVLVETEPVLVGFVTPAALGREFANTHLPLRVRELITERGEEAVLGAPVFLSAPLLATDRCLRVSPKLTGLCTEVVRRGGGRRFFEDPGWRNRLREAYERALRSVRDAFDWATADELQGLVREELGRARAELEARMGQPVQHLCLPWFTASRRHFGAMRQCGYRAVHWGAQPASWRNHQEGGLRHLWRLDEVFLRTLPGEGSISMGEALRIRFREATRLWRESSRRQGALGRTASSNAK